MGRCKTCRFGDRAIDGAGSVFHWCRALPPAGISAPESPNRDNDGLVWRIPAMMSSGWCGLYRLSIWKWLASLSGNGTRA